MRKLASIQKIESITPIEGADNIVLAKVLDWQAVVQKNAFQPGDLCVYFEIDSFLPLEERFEFLRKTSFRKNEYMGEGIRIRTMTLRGALSQGLIMPIESFPEIKNKTIGTDYTELLGVRKWFMPEVEGVFGASKGEKPYFVPTSDEMRVQSMKGLLDSLHGKPYYITTKQNGTAMYVYLNKGVFGVCTRNDEILENREVGYWKAATKFKLEEALRAAGEDLVLQMELCGHGIQGNMMRLSEPIIYLYDVIRIKDGSYYNLEELIAFSEKNNIPMVPIEETGDNFNYTIEELLFKASGDYPGGLKKEGIVIRPQEYMYVNDLHNRLSFKVLNNDFLLSEK